MGGFEVYHFSSGNIYEHFLFALGNTTAELREQDEKRKEEHAAVVEDLEEIKAKTVDTWGYIGMLNIQLKTA